MASFASLTLARRRADRVAARFPTFPPQRLPADALAAARARVDADPVAAAAAARLAWRGVPAGRVLAVDHAVARTGGAALACRRLLLAGLAAGAPEAVAVVLAAAAVAGGAK